MTPARFSPPQDQRAMLALCAVTAASTAALVCRQSTVVISKTSTQLLLTPWDLLQKPLLLHGADEIGDIECTLGQCFYTGLFESQRELHVVYTRHCDLLSPSNDVPSLSIDDGRSTGHRSSLL